MMKRLDRFSLALLGTVVLASLFPAQGRAALWLGHAATCAIALVFFLHGARLPHQAVRAGLLHWRLHLTVLVASFVLFPLLGLALRPLAGLWLPEELVLGLGFLCALPSTVQSSIGFTSIARGNVPAAVIAASLSNLAGVLLTPLLTAALLASSGGLAAPGKAVSNILLLLLAPFLAGHLLQTRLAPLLRRLGCLPAQLDRGAILLVVYAAFSHAVVAGLWRSLSGAMLALLLLWLLLLLGAAMGVIAVLTRRLGFSREDRITILFCGSKKSLATGAPMAGILFAGHPGLGMIVLPVMLFHQLQLMLCAVLAQRFARSAQESE